MKPKQPNWTITSKSKNIRPSGDAIDRNKPAYTTHKLRLKKRTVFSGRGPQILAIMQELAQKWNENGYEPEISTAKMLMDMNHKEREKLAHLWSPVLPFEEVKP